MRCCPEPILTTLRYAENAMKHNKREKWNWQRTMENRIDSGTLRRRFGNLPRPRLVRNSNNPYTAKRKTLQQRINNMKLKLLGLTIFEFERDSADSSASPRYSSREAPGKSPSSLSTTSKPMRPFAELHQSAEMLPRTRRGIIDVDASLQLLGITDPNVLWRQRFKPGTAGTVLKCILGARGQRSGQSARDQVSPDLYIYPAEDLPLVAATGKLDLAACLSMFDIQELWRPDKLTGSGQIN